MTLALFTCSVALPENAATRTKMMPETIYGLLAKSSSANPPELAFLKKLIDIAGLKGVLDAPRARLTVFAPRDDDFFILAQMVGRYNGSDIDEAIAKITPWLKFVSKGDPIGLLANILKYHVVPGKVLTTEQAKRKGTLKTAFMEKTVFVRRNGSIVDKDPEIPDPTFVPGRTNVRASNGIVHAVDGILFPVPVTDVTALFLASRPSGKRRRRRRQMKKRPSYYYKPYRGKGYRRRRGRKYRSKYPRRGRKYRSKYPRHGRKYRSKHPRRGRFRRGRGRKDY